MQELEEKKKDLEIEIAKEQIAKPKYTREQYKEFFERSKVADLTDHNQRKALINYFVNAVVLYDDNAIFYLNYNENALKLSSSKIKKCSDSLLNPLPCKNGRCANCPSREQCLSAKAKTKSLRRHVWEDHKDEFYTFTHTDVGKKIYSRRKEMVERSFADSKELFGLRYCRMRGLSKVAENAYLRQPLKI